MADSNEERIGRYIETLAKYKDKKDPKASLKHHTKGFYGFLQRNPSGTFADYLQPLGWRATPAKQFKDDILAVLQDLDLLRTAALPKVSRVDVPAAAAPAAPAAPAADTDIDTDIGELERMREHLLEELRAQFNADEREALTARTDTSSSSDSIELVPQVDSEEESMKLLQEMGVNLTTLTNYTPSALLQRIEEEVTKQKQEIPPSPRTVAAIEQAKASRGGRRTQSNRTKKTPTSTRRRARSWLNTS